MGRWWNYLVARLLHWREPIFGDGHGDGGRPGPLGSTPGRADTRGLSVRMARAVMSRQLGRFGGPEAVPPALCRRPFGGAKASQTRHGDRATSIIKDWDSRYV